jgi:hypothetical protein
MECDDVFEETEANVIKAIPLNPLLPPDRLVWRGTTDGVFSVRSAYHLGKEYQNNLSGQCSHAGKDNGVWKTIWKLGVPGPMKMFIWDAGLILRKVVWAWG